MKISMVFAVLSFFFGGSGLCEVYADNTHELGQVKQRSNTEMGQSVKPTTADTCNCYCGGVSWPLGVIACMNGYKYRCSDLGNQGKNCSWDPSLKGLDQVLCDGGEQCK